MAQVGVFLVADALFIGAQQVGHYLQEIRSHWGSEAGLECINSNICENVLFWSGIWRWDLPTVTIFSYLSTLRSQLHTCFWWWITPSYTFHYFEVCYVWAFFYHMALRNYSRSDLLLNFVKIFVLFVMYILCRFNRLRITLVYIVYFAGNIETCCPLVYSLLVHLFLCHQSKMRDKRLSMMSLISLG